MYYKKDENNNIICQLCPHNCRIKKGSKGICGSRENISGELESINYAEISSFGLDPIEKKPLFHYKPGSYIASVGSFGCNFDCGFCQNYEISRNIPETKNLMPEELVQFAASKKKDGNIGLAFTYNEPSIWYEYVLESAEGCQSNNMDVILVTNGYINKEPLKNIMPYINAMNIDLKAFNNEFYSNICKGDLKKIMDTIEYANNFCHVEIATLLIGGYNDNNGEIRELAKWLASINPDIPLHLSRYHPAYRFTIPPTPVESIFDCMKTAKEYLRYVYIGNVSNISNDTYCYKCGDKLIERADYEVKINMKTDKCPNCGANINVVL